MIYTPDLNTHCDKCGKRIRVATKRYQQLFPLQQLPSYPIRFPVQNIFLNECIDIPQAKQIRRPATLVYLRENRNNITYRQQIRPMEYVIIKLLEENNKYLRQKYSTADSYIRPLQIQYKILSHRLMNVPILWSLSNKDKIPDSSSRGINVTRNREMVDKIKRFLHTLRTNIIVQPITRSSDDTEPDSLRTRFSMPSVNLISSRATVNIANQFNTNEVNCSNLEKNYDLVSRPIHDARNMNCYHEQREIRVSSLSSQFFITRNDSHHDSNSNAADTDAVVRSMPISFMFTLQILMLLCILHRLSPLYELKSELDDFFYNPPLTQLQTAESATTRLNYFLVKLMRNTYF